VLVRASQPAAAPRLATCYGKYLEAFCTLLDRPIDASTAARARWAQRDFMDRMAENKRETKALSRLFGNEWAEAFLTDHFFAPSAVPAP
jgi:hypothetical protein